MKNRDNNYLLLIFVEAIKDEMIPNDKGAIN